MMSIEEERNKRFDFERQLRAELLNVDLSSIRVPIAKIHPQSESLLHSTQLRITKELGPEFMLNKDISEFTLYAYPSQRFDLVSWILIFNMTNWILDDHLTKHPNDIHKVIQQLKSKQFLGNGSIDRWLRICMKVLHEVMSETEVDQLLHTLTFTLSKTDEFSRFCSAEAALSYEDFIEWRWQDAGCLHQFFLILVGSACQLSDDIRNDPNYLGLNRSTAIQSSLVNDLYSLKKEVLSNVYKENAVYAKVVSSRITAQMAVNEIIGEINECEKIARIYGEGLKERNDASLSRYVDGMFDIMTGNHYWSSICRRYNQVTPNMTFP